MALTISIGAQSFEFLRTNHLFYVDKSDFIREWWENSDAVTLITRPRRFGKTLNLNMIECFFSINYANRGDLFKGLSIWKSESFRALQGTHPVIALSFASIKGTTFEAAKEGIFHLITKLYAAFSFLQDTEGLTPLDREYFQSIRMSMSDTTAAMSIRSLSEYLNRYYGKKVLILLDEYDTPLQEAYVRGYWDEMADFIRSLFNATFKTNPFMERGLLTGITRISQESIFSDLNHLELVTTTSEKYCTQFGFTEKEVFAALDMFAMKDQQELVRQWYDGFTFGSCTDIYNPWSVTSFLDKKQLKPYWANSSSNKLINNLIQQGTAEIKMTMEDLLAGKPLDTEIDEEIVFSQLRRKHGAVWSLLLASGYLKSAGQNFCPETGRYTYHLKLTNREVHLMFENMILDWFSDDIVPYHDFLKALLCNDVEYMNEYINQVAELTFSSFDTGTTESNRSHPERFYHGFVLGLIVELAGRYHISSNRESGFGRYDVILEPLRQADPAFVLEFKVSRTRKNASIESSMEDTLKEALQQIEEKHYDTELTARGITKDRIRHYGFVFEGKHVLIGQGM